MAHRILLANDAPVVHKIMAYTFMDGPFELDVAFDMEEALQKLKESRYDLIFLDFDLSKETDGYDLAKQIHETFPDVHIVMLFSDSDDVDEDRLKNAGVKAKVERPFESQKLIAVCKKIMGVSPSKKPVSKDKKEEGPETLAPLPDLDTKMKDIEDWEMKKGVHRIPSPSPNEEELRRELQDWSMEIPPMIQGGEDAVRAESKPNIPPPIGDRPLVQDRDALPQDSKNPDKLNLDLYISSEKLVPKETDLTKTTINKPEDVTDEEDRIQIPDDILNEVKNNRNHDLTTLLGDPKKQDELNESTETKIGSDSLKSPSLKDLEYPKKKTKTKVKMKSHNETLPQEDIDKIMEKMLPIIEQNIRKHCKETIERIAWEIVPDLAENIIKKEVQDIKDSVIK
ncbi:MAG: response regulator [Bacteriovoracales bacterium]|nr:response regulator [Bacteriovoracales bacterium]